MRQVTKIKAVIPKARVFPSKVGLRFSAIGVGGLAPLQGSSHHQHHQYDNPSLILSKVREEDEAVKSKDENGTGL